MKKILLLLLLSGCANVSKNLVFDSSTCNMVNDEESDLQFKVCEEKFNLDKCFPLEAFMDDKNSFVVRMVCQ